MKSLVYPTILWIGCLMIATPGFAENDAASIGFNESSGSLTNESSQVLPAVSELNGKIAYAGGNLDSFEGHVFDASVAIPVSRRIGFQADGHYSRIEDEDFFGGGGHLFWRQPEFGLLGLSGGHLSRDGLETYQIGAEGEYYFKRLTFGAFAGVGSIEYDNAAPFFDTDPMGFVGRISVDWYALDDLRLGVSYLSAFDNNLFVGEVEYQTPIRGFALTAEAAVGDYDYDHWLLGLRYYFGSKQTLRDRHRRNDPRSVMSQILHGLGLYGAEFNRQARSYLSAHPGAGSLDHGGSYGATATTLNYAALPAFD